MLQKMRVYLTWNSKFTKIKKNKKIRRTKRRFHMMHSLITVFCTMSVLRIALKLGECFNHAGGVVPDTLEPAQ